MFLQTGSNLSAANFAGTLAKDAGLDPEVPTGATVGGLAW